MSRIDAWRLPPLARFLITGAGVNTIALAFYWLWLSFGMPPEAAIILTTFPAIVVSYFINRHWSFGHDRNFRPEDIRAIVEYFVINIAAGLMQTAIVSVQFRMFGLDPTLAWAVAIVVTSLLTFLAVRYAVFNRV